MPTQQPKFFWPKDASPELAGSASQAQLLRALRLAAQYAAFAAGGNDAAALGSEACRIAATGIGAKFAKLLLYCPDEQDFIMQAGIGWREGVVGCARLDADVGTAAGFALHSGEAVVSNDLVNDRRFRVPSVLSEHGVVRSINVAVPREGDVAFGVLEVESPDPGSFTSADVAFLQLIAGSLAAALERCAQRDASEREAARQIDDHQKSYGELCHRLRNDLQLICSSVDRESRTSTDAMLRERFDRIQRQVRALATLYDHLLERGHGEDAIDLGSYLQLLCRKIVEASDFPSRGISLFADMQPVTMRPSRAVQIGIAINELVANAAEHAFVTASSGQIQVRLQADTNGQPGGCMLTVADDGCGFTKPRVGGAGLGFVGRLASRAGAELTHEDGAGTVWRLSFAA